MTNCPGKTEVRITLDLEPFVLLSKGRKSSGVCGFDSQQSVPTHLQFRWEKLRRDARRGRLWISVLSAERTKPRVVTIDVVQCRRYVDGEPSEYSEREHCGDVVWKCQFGGRREGK